MKYLTDLRIKKAKKLLQDGYKVNEVSEMVGYTNYRYFCDIFKKHEVHDLMRGGKRGKQNDKNRICKNAHIQIAEYVHFIYLAQLNAWTSGTFYKKQSKKTVHYQKN